ncbi:MAG: hypothetical protein KGJ66_12740 [Alphaproteobacteria bacterium]|nr:hypothetical protein [Alphaproteobacteria bacterium]
MTTGTSTRLDLNPISMQLPDVDTVVVLERQFGDIDRFIRAICVHGYDILDALARLPVGTQQIFDEAHVVMLHCPWVLGQNRRFFN